MNKAFKVLWNDVRRSYVVSSEAQMSHGKPARSSKTLVAAAVAGVLALGASSAFAAMPEGPITNSNLPTIGENGRDTTKLVSGQGNVVNIQTNGSLEQLKNNLSKVPTNEGGMKFIKGLIAALGPVKDENQGIDHVVITGVTGGNNILTDADSKDMKKVLQVIDKDLASNFVSQFVSNAVNLDKDTFINIGDVASKSNPLVLGVVGGDVQLTLAENNSNINVKHDGISHINVYAGNTAGVIGGSVAANLSLVSKKPLDMSMSATDIQVKGNSNVGGIIAGGLSFASAKQIANSNILGSTNLLIDTNTNFKNGAIDGLVVGALGGGVAAATGLGQATANVKTTQIDVDNGMVLGLIGGGAALVADKDWMSMMKPNDFGSFAKVTALMSMFGNGSGTAEANTLGEVSINLNKNSTTAAVMGGGIAFADAYGTNVGSSTTTVESVEMSLDGGSITDPQKHQLHSSVAGIVEALVKNKLNEAIKLVPNLDVEGVHIANLGGGATIARGSFEGEKATGKAVATSEVDSTTINLKGGYNVTTAAGGLAISLDLAGSSKDGQTWASSHVGKSLIHVTGGENILVSGGGLSYATGNKGYESYSKAEANVDEAQLLVEGGSVDGLYGGGIAVDDTNSNTPNAFANTGKVKIEVTGGEVTFANMDPLIEISHSGSVDGAPSKRTYINETAKLFKANQVAILGAGIASGGGAQANTTDSMINLSGGTVDGNVFGGGAATLGGNANVTNSVIAVSGANVTGNIYAAGLAGSELNDKFDPDYMKSSANVDSSVIELSDGKFVGNIYAGQGVTLGTGTEAKVGKSEVKILKNGVFKGGEDKVIDATGVTGDASLTMANEAIDLGKATVTGFNKVVATHQAKNFTFDFGEKKATTFEGVFDVNGFAAKEGSTLTLVGDSVLATTGKTDKVVLKVDNGVLALGDKADAMTAHDQLASVNAIPGLYLAGEVNLTGATATIGKVAEGATGVVIGANGSLMADAAAGTNVKGTITGTKDSGIYFTNVAEKDAKVVFEDGALKDFDLANGITVDNIRYDVINDKNTFTFEVITNQAQLYSLGLDGFYGEALNLIEKQDDAASKHIQSLMDQQNTAVKSGEHRHAQLNAAFNVATAAGVQTAGIEGAMLGLDQAAKRASLTNTFADGWTGFAEVTGTQVEMGGSRDMLESKTRLGGLAAGGEYTTGDWTFGALMNLGTGEVKGQGHNAGVKNDVDFYGVQGYAAKRLGQFNVVGQAGWVMTKNDINHAMGDSADVDANVYTVGARGEMQMALTDSVAMVPYVGVNYLRVETDGYTTKKGFKVDNVTQDLVNVPVGVAVKGDFGDMAGWQMKPVADIAYVHTFGDTNVEAQTGVGAATMATDMDVWSENVGRVRFGLEAQKDNMSFGFTLGGAAGSDDHREVYGQINAKYVF